jgi:hypothetical protein
MASEGARRVVALRSLRIAFVFEKVRLVQAVLDVVVPIARR